jgi:methionine synthase I (cobalamin-dependent)
VVQSRAVVILDGATGTELARRGVDVSSAEASAAAVDSAAEILADIHRDYVRAGAQILTAHTLCTHDLVREPPGAAASRRADERTARAVALARDAAGDAAVVAGALGTLAHRVADPGARRAAYLRHARRLRDCDILLVETMIDPRDAALAVEAALTVADGRPVWLAVVAGTDGHLLAGVALANLGEHLDLSRLGALLVNCTVPAALPAALEGLLAIAPSGVWTGAYPNLGTPPADADMVADTLCALARSLPLDVIGGCCGTTPDFVRRLAAAIQPDADVRAAARRRLASARRDPAARR